MRWLSSTIILLLLVGFVHSAEYPAITKYVNDFAGLLTQQEKDSLNAQCADIEKRTTVEIAIVTVKSTNGEDRTLYANHLGDKAGVGKAETDNGVVVLWSQDNEEGGAIATGRGIESILTDVTVANIGRDNRYYFDEGKFYNGFLEIISQLDTKISFPTNDTQIDTTEVIPKMSIFFWIILVIIFLVVLILVGLGATGGSGSSWSGSSSAGGGWSGGFGSGSFGGGGGKF